MNEEIKAILDRIKKHYVLDEGQDIILLNYITNLQEENDMLKEGLNYTVPQVRYNKIVNKIFKEYQILKEENEKLNKVIEDIDKYIHIFKIEDIGEKTMLILNDILLIKNGLGKDVVRLNKLTELKKEVE